EPVEPGPLALLASGRPRRLGDAHGFNDPSASMIAGPEPLRIGATDVGQLLLGWRFGHGRVRGALHLEAGRAPHLLQAHARVQALDPKVALAKIEDAEGGDQGGRPAPPPPWEMAG